jgi:hypothetical protein
MTTFRLERKSSNRSLTKFFIYDSAGAIVGSISVPPEQERDLLAHWKDASPAPVNANTKRPNAMLEALKRGPKLSKEASRRAVLRST